MSKEKNPVPNNEQQRLEALRQYNILDTLPEKQFDDITRLASIICEAPITLISLIDEKRQWFKSKVGLAIPETPRAISVCQHAIMTDEILEIENSLNDERFSDNLLVTGKTHIRFYAGAPLKTPEGYNLGTLCVIDTKPRKLSDEQREALTILANEVVTNMELRKKQATLEKEKQATAATNRLLNSFFDNSPSLIAMKDAEKRYTYVNGNMLRLFNKKIDEVIGKKINEIVPQSAADVSIKDEDEILKNKKTFKREYILGQSPNEAYYIGLSFPLINEKNEVYGIGSIANEITAAKKIENELIKSNERFLNIFYSSPVGMVITSIGDRKYINANKAFLKTFEFDSEKEIIGKSSVELGLSKPEEWNHIAEMLKPTGEFSHKEITCRTKNGREIIILGSINKIELGGDTVLLTSYIDITEAKNFEKEIQKSNERFTELFYNNPACNILSDFETKEIIDINQSYVNLIGYTKEELLGKRNAGSILKITPETLRSMYSELETQGKFAGKEISLVNKNNELKNILISGMLIKGVNDRTYSLYYINDITEQRKMELQLIEAKKTAEEANISKSSFLANMSHEIRTPLNAMLGFTDLLERTPLNTQQKEYLSAIDTSGKNLLTIINDILDFSKIEAGMLSIERIPFGLPQLLQSVHAMFFAKAQSKNLRLLMSVGPNIPAMVYGDPTRLSQILINLIGNAIKFTPTGSVNVVCEVAQKSDKKVELKFSVIDTGIGIAQEKIDKIFERFTQAESNITRTYGGTGLGLSIAKKLVEIQGGLITVTSQIGKGSEFQFTIMYDIADEKEYITPASNQTHTSDFFKGKKILIVEDNEINQKLASIYLSNEGFNVSIAENGQQAVDILEKETYDVILMDIQMPILDGYEATKKIRHTLKLTTPIIAMTANAMAGEHERCIRVGMDDYITKPFKSEVLFNMLFKFLKNDATFIQQKEKVNATNTNRITDFAYLQEFSGGSKAFMKEIVDIFLRQNPLDIEKLETALKLEDYKTIQFVCHSLQTSLGLLGFSTDVIDDVKQIEAFAKEQKQTDRIKEKLPVIIDLFKQAQKELKENFNQ